MTFHHAAISPAGEARTINAFGRIDLRIPASETGNVLSVWESVVPREAGPPLHVHEREDEMFYVLEGKFQIWCGAESFVGGPGTTVVLPRGVAHTYKNIGDAEGSEASAATRISGARPRTTSRSKFCGMTTTKFASPRRRASSPAATPDTGPLKSK